VGPQVGERSPCRRGRGDSAGNLGVGAIRSARAPPGTGGTVASLTGLTAFSSSLKVRCRLLTVIASAEVGRDSGEGSCQWRGARLDLLLGISTVVVKPTQRP
jgi:hypothetical protein